jgi:hypothetical protein
MVRRIAAAILAVLALALPVAGQTIQGDRFTLTTGLCTESSGSGSPEGVVTGIVCDRYIRTNGSTTVPIIYIKSSGTGNTGWVAIPSPPGTVTSVALTAPSALTVTGSPVTTTGTLALSWTSVPSNSLLASNGGTPAFLTSPTVTSLTATTSLTSPILASTGDITLNPAGLDVLPNTGYTVNLGALTNKYLTLHAAELWVETLVAQNTIATIGGRVLVAPTTVLTLDLAPATTTICVKHNQMASGDRAYMEADGKVEFFAMTSGPSAVGCGFQYSVTRNLDASGANQWYAGDAMLNTGTTGKGFIDLYSTSGVLSGSGPTIVGNVRTGTTYSQIAPRWAIGNLNGLYGYVAETYGFAAGDPSAAWIKVDATNGVRIGHNATTLTSIDAAGNASFTGTVNASAGYFGDSSSRVAIEAAGITLPAGSGSIRGGQTAFATGTGFWIGYTGGAYKFSLGSGAWGLQWDGTNFDIIKARVGILTGNGNILFDGIMTGLNTSGSSGLFYPGRIDTTGGYQTSYYLGANGVGLVSNGAVSATDLIGTGFLQTNSYADVAGSFIGRAGIGGAAANRFNIYWTGTAAQLWIDFSNIGDIVVSSDRRLKKDVAKLPAGLAEILRLTPRQFRWNNDNPHEDKGLQFGLIAQEVQPVLPNLVKRAAPGLSNDRAPDGILRVDYNGLIPVLIRAVQELNAEVVALKAVTRKQK